MLYEFALSVKKPTSPQHAAEGIHLVFPWGSRVGTTFRQHIWWCESNIIPKALGLDYDGADRINSQNTDYVMDQIRARCIDDSSVQIVLIGPCTHSRRYIDWEIKRALLAGNGLLGIHLPTAPTVNLPERFAANWSADGSGYAQFWAYPNNGVDLRNWIDDAYQGRTSRQTLRKNTNEVWGYNQRCKVCGITH